MIELINNRIDAYKHILETKCGNKTDLVEKITLELFEEFCLVGYIQEGMDGKWNERWQITSFGASQIQTYLNFSQKEKGLDAFIQTLGVA